MPRKSGSSKSNASTRPMTRSRSGASAENNIGDNAKDGKNRTAEITYYTKMKDPSISSNAKAASKADGFQVISKRQLKGNDSENYERLQESLAKVKEWERKHKKLDNENSNNQSADATTKESLISKSVLSNSSTQSFRATKIVTNFNIFLYATCFFIQTGTLPYLTKTLGADMIVFGQLQTVFALAQLTGGPLYGRLGDVMGERTALIVAFTSSLVSYTLMGMATSVQMLFVSRLFSVFMHVMQGSQMVATHLSSEAGRTKDLARLGFFYGLGMVVGPSLGGLVTKHFGEQSAALLAASGSFLSIILVILFIPYIPRKTSYSGQSSIDKTVDRDISKTNEYDEETVSAFSVFNIKEIFKLLFLPQVFILLLVKLTCGFPIGILQSMFSVLAIEQFGLAADQTGLVLSYVGCIALFMQGFGIPLVTSIFSDKSLLRLSAISLTIAYAVFALVRDLQDFLLLLLPLTCSMTLIQSVVTGCLTKTVPSTSTGQILGWNMVVHSAIRTITPTVGAYLISTYGLLSLGYVGVVSNLFVLLILPFVKLINKL